MLAVIAGRGTLPGRVVQAQASRPLVCALEGFAPDDLVTDISFRLEHLGTFLAALRKRGVTEVCFCGAIQRPKVDIKAIDARTLPLVPQMMKGLSSGDDAALRTVMAVFERRGFTVRAAHDLVPGLLAPEGVLSDLQPDEQMRRDAARGVAVLAALAPLDVGQACVVGKGQVLGIETIGGTDHLLSHLPAVARDVRALLVKGPKPGQDRRVDLPTVGPGTIAALHGAGLAGLVIDAGDVIVLDREETIAQANAHGLLLWSRASR